MIAEMMERSGPGDARARYPVGGSAGPGASGVKVRGGERGRGLQIS